LVISAILDTSLTMSTLIMRQALPRPSGKL
jgi:hypothetical protein